MSLRRRMMMRNASESSLSPPDGYSFAEFTKKAYNTGIIPSGKTIELDFRCTSSGNFWQIFGVQGNYCLYQAPWQNSFFCFMNSGDYFAINKNTYTTRHIINLNPTNNTATFDNQPFTPPTSRANTNVSLMLNGIRNSADTGWWSSGTVGVRKNEIYSFKMWDAEDNLIMNALPVVNDSTNEDAMYDFVNNVFLEVV